MCGACGKVNEVNVMNEDTTNDNTNISEVLREIMAIDACGETYLDLKLGEQLSYREKTGFQPMLRRIYVNSKSLDESLVRKEIRLTLESDKPFSCPPRRLSYSEKEVLQKIFDEYLAKWYIRPSESEFVSPIVLVKKKTGELRLCVDYRKLNKVTVKDNRDKPMVIWSENATNFVGAKNEMAELRQHFLKQQHVEEVHRQCLIEGIDWKFIPPRSPHFGGLWESSIKIAKFYFWRVLGSALLTFDELRTLICQISAVINP